MKTINIGLFGCGTVGQGVVKVLHQYAPLIEQRTGCRLKIKRVVDRSLKKEPGLPLDFKLVSKKTKDLLDDPQIDIVVELIGGVKDARHFVLSALKKGKHVVTANKALLAEHGQEIFEAAIASNCDIYYEASVCGGIPIIKALREGFVANHIEAMYGIVNGTCNYILTKMQETGLGFKEVLKEAQQKGYAEANPAFDVEGTDSAHKLSLMASLMTGQWVPLNQISVEGISAITHEDIEYGEMLGYVIKLLAVAKEAKGKIDVRVHPTLLEKKHPLASVSGVFNAIFLKGEPVGHSLFYGRGAGEFPTASAVVSDLVDISLNLVSKTPNRIPPFWSSNQKKQIKSVDKSEYYLRFTVIDSPGVLAKIAGALGKQKISIASVIQRERNEGEVVTVVVLTHTASSQNIKKALDEINQFDVVKRKTMMIRVEREV